MQKLCGWTRTTVISVLQKTRVRKGLIAVLTAFFLLQSYFVRELLLLELLFGLGFAVVLLLGGPAYLIGWAGVTWLQQTRRDQLKAIPLSEENRCLDREVNFAARP